MTGPSLYTIQKADLLDPLIDMEVRHLIKAAFKEEDLRPEGHFYSNINSNASRPSFMLVAREKGAIIGCNAFIANDFYLDGRSYVGYQSCWTATHPDHQGKKVFVNIINEAKRMLAHEGAGFLYGLPNDNSYPIFVKKLDFVEFETLYTRVLNIPYFKDSNLESHCAATPTDALLIDEEQLFAHKKLQKGEAILRVDIKKSFIWGKIERRKKFGIGFNVFIVGGIQCTEPQHVKGLFAALFKKYKVSFAELISPRSNFINSCIRKWNKAPSLNGFIYYNLNMPENVRLSVMFGSIDVF